ncbi:unnamed protein product [Symbiodinium necroappetens]|uniref:Uncharacterized protein n=1 Tax=Symbiodinium necroappetens TaxID=1628268 RepID=A0A812V7Q8_9DINO|nr:unnamed protein product [Symbiodinium necroappetens]
MSGWEVIACKEEQRFCSAARAVQTADAYRCESDSEEGSSTVALSQRSGDGVDANPFSLWWSGLLKEATAEAGFRPHSTAAERGPIKIMSSCSGSFAEGFVMKALNIEMDIMSVAESDESYRSFISANHNDGGGIKHMFKSMEDQMSGHGCLLHSGQQCHVEQPDLGVLGTPCNPFSRYRHDRYHAGSVMSHSQLPLTMERALEWLLLFQPATVVLEQVEGFMAPLSCDEDGTPFDRQAIGCWIDF